MFLRKRVFLPAMLLILLTPTLGRATDPEQESQKSSPKTEISVDPSHKTDTLSALIDPLEDRYRKILNFQASFIQQNQTSIPGRNRKTNGTVSFEKPGKIRWDYETPKQQIIIQGDRMWTVKPDLNQVVIQKLASAIQSKDVIALLTGAGKLTESFVIDRPKDFNDAGNIVESEALELTPKSSELGLARLILVISKRDYLIYRSYLYDQFGNITQINYQNYTLDTNRFQDGFFSFTPTPGMEVIDSPL